MTPHKLTLKGFTGIRCGLGLAELSIDFDALFPGATLIAVKAANGSGKSTILDNMHPYRLMPSRASSYSPKAFSYYDHTDGDALKELEWSHNGTRYRSTIVIKASGKTKKTDAYLHMIDEGGQWVAARATDGTVSDGKAETYDRCVESVLGSPEMFFTSAFAAQGRRPLSAYKNADVKDLFAELLDLDHILALGEQANQVGKAVRAELQRVGDQIDGLDRKAAQRDDLAEVRGTLQARAADLGVNLDKARASVRELTQELAIAQAESGAAASVDRQRRELQERLERIVEDGRKAVDELHENMNDERAQAEKIRAPLRDRAHELAAGCDQARKSIEAAEALEARSGQVLEAERELVTLKRDRAALAENLETARRQVEERSAVVDELHAKQTAFNQHKQVGTAAAATLQQLTEQAALIQRVPCAGSELQERCELLAGANAAQAQAQACQQRVDAARAECQTLKSAIDQATAELEALGDPAVRLKSIEDERRDLDLRIADAEHWVAKRAELDRAGADKAAAAQRLEDLTTKLVEARQQQENADAEHRARAQALGEKLAATEESTANRYLDVSAELAKLADQDQASRVQEASEALEAAEEAANRFAREYQEAADLAAAAGGKLEALDQDLARAPGLNATRDALADELGHWQTLTKALGKDGIVALSIDDAGPTLADLANDLLLSCYGPRFTAKIVTQETTGAGTTREQFGVEVFDAQADDVKWLTDMSGGERIWINEAITRAIALYQAQQSGHRFDTLFSDESDGALDDERKAMFIAMKRRVLELGGYRREYFISHTPALWELADAVLDVQSLKTKQEATA